MTQPLIFLLLFGPAAVRHRRASGTGAVAQWFVPGILVMLALFGTARPVIPPSSSRCASGSLERMLVTPLEQGRA